MASGVLVAEEPPLSVGRWVFEAVANFRSSTTAEVDLQVSPPADNSYCGSACIASVPSCGSCRDYTTQIMSRYLPVFAQPKSKGREERVSTDDRSVVGCSLALYAVHRFLLS